MALYPPLRPPKVNRSGDLDAQALRDDIFGSGVEAGWRRALTCPCTMKLGMTGLGSTKPIAHQPQSDCVACFGTGWIYEEPFTIPIQATGAELQPHLQEIYGREITGALMVTFFP